MDPKEEYPVEYIQVKAKDAAVAAKIAAEIKDKKVYIQICPDDALMVQASLVDKDLMDAIDIWRLKGYNPCLQTGKPGGCPPGGCH